MRWTSLICAVTLAACSPPSGQDEAGAPFDFASAAPRAFEPMSKTAEAFTGALTVTPLERTGPNAPPRYTLSAALGHSWDVSFVGRAALGDPVGDDTLGSFFQGPDDAALTIYAVEAERVQPDTANGGLCMPVKTGFLAVTESGDAMQIAAFSGDAWPPAADRPPPLCGTFNYALRK